MSNGRIANPADVLMEQPNLDAAEEFVASTSALASLPLEERGQAVDHVARMTVIVEVQLLTAELGAQYAESLTIDFSNGDKKAIVVEGEKLEDGVVTRAHWVDQELLRDLFPDYDLDADNAGEEQINEAD